MSGTNQLSKFDYTYSPVGTIATWTQQADSGTATVSTLVYDNADQLTRSTLSGGTTGHNYYAYDPAGNRLVEATATRTTAGQFNSVNQLKGLTTSSTTQTIAGHTSAAVSSVSVDAVVVTPGSGISNGTNFSASVQLPNGTNTVSVVATPSSTSTPITTQRYQVVLSGAAPTALTYDLNGNVLTDENGYHYAWDALNRLTKITYSGGATSNFAYDGLSRRISIIEKNSGGTVTSTKNYLWIGSEIAEERSSGTAVTKRFFPQGEQQTGTNYYYTRDHLGSVRELINSSGTLLSRYSYDPYGRITTTHTSANTSSPPIDATFQYASYYAHATRGLNLTKHRAFDANTGRWLSRDPIEEEGGINLYDYVGNNPIDDIDPFGLVDLDLQNPQDPNRAPMKSINPSGQYSVHAHGNPSIMEDDRNASTLHGGKALTPADLLKIMKQNGYKGGPITLYACETGKGKDPFAKELAKLAKATVTAPTDLCITD